MSYFGNNRNVNFKLLKESGLYSQELLNQLRCGNYAYLNETIDIHLRENEDFMEPLLYAVKQENGTYEIFKHYGENLQVADLGLAIEVIIEEPELIEDTAVSNNKKFILELAEVNPEVIMYMSYNLKSDGEFVEKLCEVNNKEITAYVAKECDISKVIQENPNLASNPNFMKEAIKKDANSLRYLNEDLKNNYEFIKETCKANSEAINYVAEHTEEFGGKALKATQEVLRNEFNNRVTESCQEESKRLQQEIEQKEKEGATVKPTIVARKKRIEKRPELLDKRLKGLEDGDEKAIRYAELMLGICKGIEESDRTMLSQSLKIGKAIAIEKQKEEKKDIKPQNIEKLSKDAKLSEIQEETTAIREEITAEKEQTNEKNELGEK